MAFINLLHNGYQGKLGETVGQKWKNQRTVRTYNPHNNSKSQAQLTQRGFYKELITLASTAYPSRNNFPKSPSKKMNGFNYYTRIIKKMNDITFEPRKSYPVDIFSTKGICHPTRYRLDGQDYVFIVVPQSVETVSVKDYKLVVIFNRNYRTKEYLHADIMLSNIGEPKQFKLGYSLFHGRRGFLCKIENMPSYATVTMVSVARRKGPKWEYSEVFDLDGRQNVYNDSFETVTPPLTVIR